MKVEVRAADDRDQQLEQPNETRLDFLSLKTSKVVLDISTHLNFNYELSSDDLLLRSSNSRQVPLKLSKDISPQRRRLLACCPTVNLSFL